MKTFLLLCALTVSLMGAEPPVEGAKTEKKVTLEDVRKELDAAQAAAKSAWRAAAKARQEGNVFDPDPEGAAVIPEPKGTPETESYLKLKKAYLAAKAALEKAERRYVHF